MSDRIKGLVVVFDEDLRDEDAEKIANAIRLFPNVGSVESSAWDNDDLMNRSRIQREIEQKLWAVLHPPKP